MSRGNRISLKESIKRRDPELAGLNKKITQKESQKIDFIVPVLDYGLNHKQFSVPILRKQLGISRNSLDRTISLLLEKKLINLNKSGIKNEKFYKITSNPKSIKYRDNLLRWKTLKISIKVFSKNTINSIDKYQRMIKRVDRIIKGNTKKNKFKARNFSNLESIPIRIQLKVQQTRLTEIPWSRPVYLKSLPATYVHKIKRKYENYRLCDICLKNGYLVDLNNISAHELVCTKEGHCFDSIDK